MPSLNLRIRNRLRWMYVVTDLVTTNLAMFCFNVFRWSLKADSIPSIETFYGMPTVWGGQVFFPLLMMFVYWLSGYYNHVEQRSRAQEVLTTLGSAFTGALLVFFLAVVNDSAWRRRLAFENIFIFTAIFFITVYIGRLLITRIEVRRIHRRLHITDALLIGADAEGAALGRRINGLAKGMGVRIAALVRLPGQVPDPECDGFEVLDYNNLTDIIGRRGVGTLILSPAVSLKGIGFSRLMRFAVEQDVPLFVSPDVNFLALAARRQFNVMGEPLICISHPGVSDSTANIKRVMDVLGSALALVLCSPLFAALAIAIKSDSPGPVFFRQTRLGRGGKPFRIIKFRSMITGAEADGEARLTADDDPRITRIGRFMRKYRLDELPQFWNVIRGEMSLVGPRPERGVFAEQIAARVPGYPLIYQVRPGITSWGMVRYGYASNVDQMVERLRYDLLYLETISISTDLKILLHTVDTVISGRGK